ncbi:MAG: DNA/RNA non-specific endonuclease [Oscillospiraceae bacterium]|nr:DNA/RNA non-specific endonuclease [Oscillospiraceae bacterium]
MSRTYRNKNVKWKFLTAVAVLLLIAFWWISAQTGNDEHSISVEDVPAFSGNAYVVIQNNQPNFTQTELTDQSYEYYAPLDTYGRCGYTMACIGQDLMPTEDRGNISQVKPTGWVQAQYDCVDGKNLYNRCHLIGFQLTGENANERNLITGTRFCNNEGMLPFENMVADYVKETGNHVLYRVTPIFQKQELVARGVQMEAYSVEDDGAGICFNVYVYNCQPGVVIDYATGDSCLDEELAASKPDGKNVYILNTSSKKFHKESCGQGQGIKENNKEIYTGSREDLVQKGYTASKCCNP